VPDFSFTVSITGRDRVARAAARFQRAARGGLQRKLTAAIRAEGPGALAAVRSAWRGVEVDSTRGGGSSSGLRGRAAAATRRKSIANGVSFEVEPSSVDPVYGKSLSYGLDGLGRWRHPVWGNTRVWTQQTGQEVFFKTLRGYEAAWRNRLERAIDEVAREIEG
jgi:hypothetical protein